MTDTQEPTESTERDAFILAGQEKRKSFVAELLFMLRTNRKWWMLPLIALLVVLGLFVLVTSTAAGPLIYALF